MDLLKAVFEDVWQNLLHPLLYFTDPGERINVLYLISSLLLAYYVFKTSAQNLPFYKYIFHKKIWASRSAFVDYKLFIFNGFLKIVLILPAINAWRYLGVYTNDFLEENFEPSSLLLSQTQILIAYSIAVVIIYDFVYYLVHLVMHKVPFLWEFHKIHHSATTLNPITQYRLHPVELILNNLSYFVVSAVLMGVGDYFYQGVINQAVYAEVNIFAMLFLFWGANLRHSHVKLRYFNFVERLVISPFQHQIHHSNNPAHFDKNLGAKFALWDWLFGTLIRSEKQKTLRFGLGSKESSHYDTFLKTLYQPFKKIFTWSKNQ
jgi:sterol desaturase/sphingolipid hydroxylase (fatty acid hydroxylase superfamily)